MTKTEIKHPTYTVVSMNTVLARYSHVSIVKEILYGMEDFPRCSLLFLEVKLLEHFAVWTFERSGTPVIGLLMCGSVWV